MINLNKKTTVIFMALILFLINSCNNPNLDNTINNTMNSFTFDCQDIRNGLKKDLCYKDKLIFQLRSSGPLDEAEVSISYIQNPYIKRICNRIIDRPHMVEFITKNISAEEDYYQIHTIFLEAIKYGKKNVSKVKEICDLENEALAGECQYYVMTSLSLNKSSIESNIKDYKNFCSEIKDKNWRSECFFLLADEISKTKEPNLKIIDELCTLSSTSKYFGCHDHVVYLLESNKTELFCNITNKEFKKDCYGGLGGTYYINKKNESFALCNTSGFRNFCFEGIFGIMLSYNEDMKIDLNYCKSLEDKNLSDLCFIKIARHGWFEDRMENTHELCEDFPEKYKEECILGYIYYLSEYLLLDIEEGVKKCSEISVNSTTFKDKHSNFCYNLLLTEILMSEFYNDPKVCDKLPDKYSEECKEKMLNKTQNNKSK